MKGYVYVISCGVIALGLLGGNVRFNMTQCKLHNGTNISSKMVDHVCIYEWCYSACRTSGVLLSATPWIVIFTMCMFLFICFMPCEPVKNDNSIQASFQALSLDHHDSSKPVHQQHRTSSWLHELHRLELLGRSHTPSPVAMDTKKKPFLTPSRFNGTGCVSQSSQSQDSAKYKSNASNNCRRHHCIITLLSFVLFISVMTNIGLMYWIITS